ncbi:hypothetical protein GCM10020218_061000 [Dactylosporangium vinaceum]
MVGGLVSAAVVVGRHERDAGRGLAERDGPAPAHPPGHGERHVDEHPPERRIVVTGRRRGDPPDLEGDVVPGESARGPR